MWPGKVATFLFERVKCLNVLFERFCLSETLSVARVAASQIVIGADTGFLHCLDVKTGRSCGRLPTCGAMDTLPSVDTATGRWVSAPVGPD